MKMEDRRKDVQVAGSDLKLAPNLSDRGSQEWFIPNVLEKGQFYVTG